MLMIITASIAISDPIFELLLIAYRSCNCFSSSLDIQSVELTFIYLLEGCGKIQITGIYLYFL